MGTQTVIGDPGSGGIDGNPGFIRRKAWAGIGIEYTEFV